jgi:hypothetical protein
LKLFVCKKKSLPFSAPSRFNLSAAVQSPLIDLGQT